jgi:hypothetical protein
MYRSPFFETFFADAEVQHPSDHVDASVAGLTGQVQTLTRNMFDLQLVVAALIETLHRIELADPATLRETVEEELARVRKDLAAKTAEQAAARTAKAAVAATPHQAAAGNTTCARCGKIVPSSRTTITETGIVCDLCAAGLPA